MDIELIETDSHGIPCALVSVDGDLCEVTRRFGSWRTLPDDRGVCRQVLTVYATQLQAALKGKG